MANDEVSERNNVAELKRKLAWRMGFAGLLIVVLLGTLALFENLSAPSDSDDSSDSSQTAPAPKREVTQPVKIAAQPLEVGKDVSTEAPELPKVSDAPVVRESSTAPVDKSSPMFEPPPRPQIAAQPALPIADTRTEVRPAAKPEARPDARAAVNVQSRSDTRPAAMARAPWPPGVPPAPSAPMPATRTTTPVPGVQPPAGMPTVPPGSEDYPEVARPQPSPPRLFSGFSVQAGVFNDLHRAEEMQAKLSLHGIPATFEVRVKVGPFSTREEADAAREKMKELGIDTVLSLPKGIRR